MDGSVRFYLLSGLKHQVFSITIFRLLPSLINFLFIDLQNILNLLKLVSAIFYQVFIFSPNDSLSKTLKNAFDFI